MRGHFFSLLLCCLLMLSLGYFLGTRMFLLDGHKGTSLNPTSAELAHGRAPRAINCLDGFCQLRSEHFFGGMPRPVDSRYNFTPPNEEEEVPGISILVREGFVVGHADKFKVPLWVAVHWNSERYRASEGKKSPAREFHEDLELPQYARSSPKFHSLTAVRYDRGHMARNQDNLAWGEDNVYAGCLMSNIAPQKPHLNQDVWNALEDQHRRVVARGDFQELWIISGAVLPTDRIVERLENDTAVPEAFYKVIAWHDSHRKLQARAYLFPQDAQSAVLENYLVSIDTVEAKTGLDFLPELAEDIQKQIESNIARALWVD